jgi:DNA-binding GntR family transcriptional regulator
MDTELRRATSKAGRGEATPPKAELIRRAIVDAILEHRLAPGTKLGEDEIGSLWGVSRTIVRSVLQRLAHDGIVEIEKNRGAFVSQPSVTDAQEVFDARQLIEARTTALAAERRPADGIRRLGENLTAEARAVAAGDAPTAIRLSGEFHLELARMAGHRTYENFLRELVARSSLIILLYRRHQMPICSADHHAELVEAVASGRSAAAVSLMRHHLDELRAELDLEEPRGAPRSLAEILRE